MGEGGAVPFCARDCCKGSACTIERPHAGCVAPEHARSLGYGSFHFGLNWGDYPGVTLREKKVEMRRGGGLQLSPNVVTWRSFSDSIDR